MGFWIFIFIMDLLTPITMIGFGRYFKSGGPKDINLGFGYRTSMSMKNKATWKFAHEHCGRLWWVVGWILILVTVVVMCFVLGKDTDLVGKFGGILCLVQIVPLVGSIIPTEIALRKHFDKNGNKKN